MDIAAPAGSSISDTLSDVSDERVTFTRQDPGAGAGGSFNIAVLDIANSMVTEIDPQPNAIRMGSAIGGSTVAFVDFGTGNGSGDIFSVDISASNLVPTPVSLSPLLEQNPNVSPNGDAIVWEQCPTPSDCNVMKALQWARGGRCRRSRTRQSTKRIPTLTGRGSSTTLIDTARLAGTCIFSRWLAAPRSSSRYPVSNSTRASARG